MEKTALEWFVEQLPLRILNQYQEEIQKAKEMEKEQTIKFADDYADTVIRGSIKLAKEYYNDKC